MALSDQNRSYELVSYIVFKAEFPRYTPRCRCLLICGKCFLPLELFRVVRQRLARFVTVGPRTSEMAVANGHVCLSMALRETLKWLTTLLLNRIGAVSNDDRK